MNIRLVSAPITLPVTILAIISAELPELIQGLGGARCLTTAMLHRVLSSRLIFLLGTGMIN